jgi:thioredoxin-like negative regulator of GroEL
LANTISEENDEIEPETNEEPVFSTLVTHLSLGDKLYYEEHNFEKAIEEYGQAIEEEKDELIWMKATYLMAECFVKLEKFREAKELFRSLAVNYKEHYLKDSARKRLEHLADYLVSENE